MGGRLITGFELNRGYDGVDYDESSEKAGLLLENRWSTWDRQPFLRESTYLVSVHVRSATSNTPSVSPL